MISEQHELLSKVVSKIYLRVDWRSMTSIKRSAVDVLTDRIRVACKEQDILQAHDKLCATLNIPTSKQDVADLEKLYSHNEEIMQILREHSGYIAALAQKKAKEYREQQKRLKESKENSQ